MRLGLVPKHHLSDVIHQRQVLSFATPPEGLYRHPQVLFEPDRVAYVPAVHPKPLLRLVQPVRLDYLVQTRIRGSKLLVLMNIGIFKTLLFTPQAK